MTDRPDTHDMVLVHRVYRREFPLVAALIRAVEPGAGGDPMAPSLNPGLLSIPVGLVAAVAGTLLARRRPEEEDAFTAFEVRSLTGVEAG